jgi:hypothetical protein
MEARRYAMLYQAYYSRSHLHLRDLPENHLKRVKEVPFAFQ